MAFVDLFRVANSKFKQCSSATKRLRTKNLSSVLLFALTVGGSLYAQDALEKQLAQEFDYDDPKGTELRLKALASEAEKAGNNASLAEILSQVARAEGLQGRLDDAERTLDRAAVLTTDAVGPRVRLLIERGRLARRRGRLEPARVDFEKAYDLAVPADKTGLAADAAHMLAIILPFNAARVWTDRGLVLAEQSSDPTVRHWVGVFLNNWGERLDEQGDHQEAALAFARALASRRLENEPAVSRESEFALAVQLRKLGLPAQALAIQQRLHREATLAKEPVGKILIEKVENLSALGRKDEARRTAEDALRSLPKQSTPTEQVDRLNAILKEMSAH